VTPTLTTTQRWALSLAEAHGWGVQMQAVDGTRVTLRHEQPARALVLYLNDAARAADTRTYSEVNHGHE